MPGATAKTLSRALCSLGAKNQEDDERRPAKKLADWAKTNKGGASLLWQMVERDQVRALRGESFAKDKRSKPLYKHTTTWGGIQVCDMKDTVLGLGWVDKSTFRMITKGNLQVVHQLFVFGTARNPDRPISKGMTHGELQQDIAVRYRAVGQRLRRLEVDEGRVAWERCGPWHIERDGDAAFVVHRYHGARARLPDGDAHLDWSMKDPWDEWCCTPEAGAKTIQCRKLFNQSLFDYASQEFKLRQQATSRGSSSSAQPAALEECAQAECDESGSEVEDVITLLESGTGDVNGVDQLIAKLEAAKAKMQAKVEDKGQVRSKPDATFAEKETSVPKPALEENTSRAEEPTAVPTLPSEDTMKRFTVEVLQSSGLQLDSPAAKSRRLVEDLDGL